ncbi:hypothetical protein BDN72DRAFT_894520 [Pluteus cervinus]|uniref:Uncharacterized protein n=1 Tax=Pluteus cervinus TaxID=181527 RepID=A0ACD3B3Y0_9AGAR|nr:hypothetical protein BDN72DRAFT_894520 [Pluteus cervinus]
MSAPADNQGVAPANTTSTSNPGGGGQATASNVAQAPPSTSNNQNANVAGISQNATGTSNPTQINVKHSPDNALTPWAPRLEDPEILMATSPSGIPEGSEPFLPVNYRFRQRIRLPYLSFDMSTLTEEMIREAESKGR